MKQIIADVFFILDQSIGLRYPVHLYHWIVTMYKHLIFTDVLFEINLIC